MGRGPCVQTHCCIQVTNCHPFNWVCEFWTGTLNTPVVRNKKNKDPRRKPVVNSNIFRRNILWIFKAFFICKITWFARTKFKMQSLTGKLVAKWVKLDRNGIKIVLKKCVRNAQHYESNLFSFLFVKTTTRQGHTHGKFSTQRRKAI